MRLARKATTGSCFSIVQLHQVQLQGIVYPKQWPAENKQETCSLLR